MNDALVTTLMEAAAACLGEPDVDRKVELTRNFARLWRDGGLALGRQSAVPPLDDPGLPDRPRLVPASQVPRRTLSTAEGQGALVHSIAHIEFNAINLAWDAVYRFRTMPSSYYHDWVRVADEEGQHFGLLRERLKQLGYDYGDFDAHGGLWDMAVRTAGDVLERMALVPRVLEARGLDATPRIMERLRHAGDTETVRILEIILRDEIGHVEIGSRWFHWLCDQRGLDREQTFQRLIQQYLKGQLRGPFHYDARRQAGFSDAELAALDKLT